MAVIDTLRNLYQQAVESLQRGAESQRRAVEADQAVAREQTRRVQNAAQNLYSAYQQQQERAARAQQEQTRLQSQRVQEAANNLYQQAVQRQQQQARLQQQVNRAQAQGMSAVYGAVGRGLQQTEQTNRAKAAADAAVGMANNARVQSALRDMFNAYDRQQRSAVEADQRVQAAEADALRQGAAGAAKAVFNAIPGQLAKGIAVSDEDQMRYNLQRAGYSDSAIEDLVASGMVSPTARYDREQADSFGGQFAANYNIGDLQQQADILLGQGIIRGNQEWIQRGMEMRELAAQYQQNNQAALGHDSGTLGNMIAGDMAQYAPQFLYQQLASLPAQAAAVILPNKYVEAAAQAFGSGSLSYTTMAGAAYADMIDRGADPETAAQMAKDEAFISSLIESGDTFLDFAFGPLAGLNPFAGIGKKAATHLAGRLALGFGKWALNVGQEYAEEASQELVSMANERRLAEGKNGGIWELFDYIFKEAEDKAPELLAALKNEGVTEDVARLHEAGTGGAVIGGFMGLFGSATGAIRSGVSRSQANRAFDSLVADPDQTALSTMTNDQLTNAIESAQALNRTDAAEILEAEQERRAGERADDIRPYNENETGRIENETAENETAPAQDEAGETTANVGNTIINTDPSTHTAEKQKTIDEYIKSTDSGLIGFLNKLRGLKDKKVAAKLNYRVSQVSESEADAVSALTDLDVTGYSHNLNGENLLLHIVDEHGAEGSSDQSLRYDDDVARINYVLNNFDEIDLAYDYETGTPQTSWKYRDKSHEQAPVIVYKKSLDGTYYVVEAVPETASKRLQIISAYIGPKTEIGAPDSVAGTPIEGSRMSYADAQDLTPEAAYASPSTNSIRSSDENSNPQNEEAADVSQNTNAAENGTNPEENARNGGENAQSQNNAPAGNGTRTLQELRREFERLGQEYNDATARNDTEFDYDGQMERIREVMAEIERAEDAESGTQENAGGASPAPTEANEDPHPERGELDRRGVRICKDTEALEAELGEVGEAKLHNDSGKYRARIRQKTEGGVLLTIDRDGKRLESKTFGNVKDAAEYAAGIIDGFTRGAEDAELDRNKSEKIPRKSMLEELVTGKQQDEYERQKKNKAAEAGTQALRERMRRIDAELKALRRLEKAPGLTAEQQAHKADLQQTLEIINDEINSRKGRARAKKKTVEVKGNKPVRSTAEARREIMDKFHIPEGSRKEIGDAIQQRLDEMLANGSVTEESVQALFDTLMDAGVVPKQAESIFRSVRDDLTGRRIYVSEETRADLGDNWNALYNQAWGDRIFLTKNPEDARIDAINQDLAQAYGESRFPQGGALSDMLENMLDTARKGRTTQQALREAVADEARYTDTTADEIYGEMFRDVRERLRAFGKEARIEVDLKDRTASMLATERQRWEDRLEQQAQRRRESQIREKVLNQLQRAQKLRSKAAPEVRAQLDEALRDIDTYARTLTIDGIEDLQALQRAYDEAKKAAGWESDEHPGNWIPKPYIEKKLERLSKIQLNDMDIEDVIELGQTVQALEHQIRTQNQMIGEEFNAEVRDMATAVDADVNAAEVPKAGFIQKWFAEEQLSPRRFLELLGGWKKNGAMGKLAASLENGQTKMLDFLRRAEQSLDPFMSKKENKKWLKTASGQKATWSTYGVVNGMAMDGSGFTGDSIEITPMMKIALYLHSLNEDNLRHIQEGGIRVPDKTLYMKGKISEAYAAGKVVKMQPQAVRAIASTLTQQEKTFAGYLQKFFNEQSKAAINEVSMQLDGFERANVENYFPIETDQSFIKSDVSGEARARTVEGIGSIANERVHAQNPIRLCDAYDTFVRQVDNVGRYYGYAIPIRNFQAVNNYVFHKEGNAYAGSVKDTINRKWRGTGAESYITKLLEDLQGGSGSKTDIMSRGLARLRSNLAGSNLAINPNVAFSQTASYPGAAQAVGWDGLAAGLSYGPRTAAAILSAQPGMAQAAGAEWISEAMNINTVDEKLIEKYTPLLWYRSKGYSTQEIGDAVAAEKKSLPQKLLASKALNWIQGMDRFTVKRLWAAAEYRVSKDNPNLKPGSKAEIDAGTDAYYKAVAEVFNRAVYDTQPNYTAMQRPQILRSNSELTKMLTMYKTVPLQYYNMTVEAVGRLQAARKSGNAAELAEARRYAANTFGGILAANSIYVAMKALIGKFFRKKDDDYRDEEGNLTFGSVFKQLGKDLAETYAGSIIGGAEAYSLIDGWVHGQAFNAPEVSPLAMFEDIGNDLGGLFGAIGDDDHEKAAKAAKSLALDLSAGFGLPVRNAESYILAAIGWVSPKTVMAYENIFGGIHKSDLKDMDENTVGIGVNLILRNRTGEDLDRSATDELARLYAVGLAGAVPTNIPDSFSYGGNEVEIRDRGAYSDAWGGVVGDNLEELLSLDDYRHADDKTKTAMVNRLYQYATVQARMGAYPDYSPEGSSTYGWTLKADEAVDAGIDLPTAIAALTMFGQIEGDKDESGKTVSGSKKTHVVEYIDGLDLDGEQKDLLYELAGYTTGLEDTPWNGGTGLYTGTGTTKLTIPKGHEAAYQSVIDRYMDVLTESEAYKNADSTTKKALVNRLREYATVQAVRDANPEYSPGGSSYGWTLWADQAVKAGIDLNTAIGYMTQLGAIKADYDEYGKAISGTKKDNVCAYIDGLNLTPEQKDVLYLYVYNQNSLKYTPWHGYTGKKRSGGRRGGRRRSSGSAKAVKPVQVGQLAKGYDTGIDVSALFGVGSSSGRSTGASGNASAGLDLLEIVNKYYDGNALAAAIDGGRKARTRVDFEV